MGRTKIDRRRNAMLLGLGPAAGTKTPAIARYESRKTKLRPRRHEIVAPCPRKFEKLFGEHGTHRVRPPILVAGIATPIAEKACHRIVAARLQRLIEYVKRFVHTMDYATQRAPGCGRSDAGESSMIFCDPPEAMFCTR